MSPNAFALVVRMREKATQEKRNKSMNVFVELYMWVEKAHSKREWYDVEVPKTHLRLYDEFSFIVFFLFYYTILYFLVIFFYMSACAVCLSLIKAKCQGWWGVWKCYNLAFDVLSDSLLVKIWSDTCVWYFSSKRHQKRFGIMKVAIYR